MLECIQAFLLHCLHGFSFKGRIVDLRPKSRCLAEKVDFKYRLFD